jgi:hypothetical protein
MTTTQLFFSLVGVMTAFAATLKWYIDAKIDPVSQQVKQLVDYMILHEGKIATLEERIKGAR